MNKLMAVGLAALLSIAPLQSRADEFPGLAIGQTVRLTKASGQPGDVASQGDEAFQNLPRRFRAEVKSMDEDSLSLSIDDDGETVVVPRRLIEKLEVSRGRSHQRGAAHGLAIGLAIGTVVGLVGDDEGCPIDSTPDTCMETGSNSTGKDALFGALVGAAVGAVIGIQRWEGIEPGQPSVALTLPRRGVGAQISVTW